MNTKQYLHTFFKEKDLPYVEWELVNDHRELNFISNEVVIEHILAAPDHEQKQIANIIRSIDFANGDINHFLKHLAGAIINQ